MQQQLVVSVGSQHSCEPVTASYVKLPVYKKGREWPIQEWTRVKQSLNNACLGTKELWRELYSQSKIVLLQTSWARKLFIFAAILWLFVHALIQD